MSENKIIEELREVAPLLLRLKKPPQTQLGSLSESYFNEFEHRLMQKIEQIEELEEIAPLLSELKKPVATQLGALLEGYFSNFEEKLLDKLEESEGTPLLDSLEKNPEMQLGAVPYDYFEHLEQKLEAKIEAMDESEALTPFLHQLKKPANEQLGAIPENYFNDFDKLLSAKLENERAETKVVALKTETKIRLIKPVYVMGAAASVLLLVISGLWYLRGSNTSSPFDYTLMANMNIEAEMNKMELADAGAYLLENIDDLETEDIMESLNEEAIRQLSNANIGSIISLSPSDTLPPKVEPKPENPTNTNPTANTGTEPMSHPKAAEGSLEAELEDEVAEETDLEELFSKIKDDDFAALEAALLKPKKKETLKEKKE